MKIDFKNLKVYTNLEKTQFQLIDVIKELSEGIYKTAQGIAGYALAMKMYNSKGEEDYTEEEFSIIENYANTYGTPFFIDALKTLKENAESNTELDKTNE